MQWPRSGSELASNHLAHDDLRQYQFMPALREANLPLIRIHDLRHTAATLLLLQGVHPKLVSEMLGHASIAITLDLYSKSCPTCKRTQP